MLRELGVTVLTENEVSCWSLIMKFISSCQSNSQLVFSTGNNREVQVLSVVLAQFIQIINTLKYYRVANQDPLRWALFSSNDSLESTLIYKDWNVVQVSRFLS